MRKLHLSNLLALVISLLFVKDSISQGTSDQQIAILKNVAPPSPNSSNLGKYGEWPVGLYTGVPNINVPVCELKGRSIAVPVSLSYHASGNKVGETPSWVGLGWSLNAGGAVTRSIRGMPDEDGYFTNSTNYTNPNDYSSAAINQTTLALTIVGSVLNSTDTQEDIYSFSALGKSYKFILKADGSMQTIPASGVKLIANPIAGASHTANTWTILLEDGTKLLFGGNNFEEITNNPRFKLSDGSGITYTSSWMLQSITTTSNEVIAFTYSQTSINQDSYYSQSDFIEYKTGTNLGVNTQCPTVTHSAAITTSVEKQTVLALNPATIESELGRIEFMQSTSDRQDLPGTKSLQEIKVFSKLANAYIEDYFFTTSYSTAVSSNVLTTAGTVNDTYVNYRLRLNSFEKRDITNPASKQQWTFDYNTQNLPARRSFSQDHWGFFNGANTNTTLLPEVYFFMPSTAWIISQQGGSQTGYGFMPGLHNIGANREPNANFLQAEMLSTIHYPTGGYSNFTYEPNAVPDNSETFTKTNLSLALNMSATQNPQTNTVTTTFTITKPQYINLTASSYISPAIFTDLPGAKTSMEVFNSSGVKICGISNTDNKWFNFINAGTYTLKVSSNVDPADLVGTTNSVSVSATLKYYLSNGSVLHDRLVGGLRIKKIVDFDAINAGGSNERNFLYESPLEINPVDVQNDYITTQDKTQDFSLGETCDFKTVTRNTSSRFALGSIQGGTVAYGKVTTLYGPGGINGQTVSLFTNEPDGNVTAAKIFPYPSTDSRDHRRGLLLEETQYKSDLTTILKKTTHHYSFNSLGYTRGFKAGYSKVFLTSNTACLNNISGSCGITSMFMTTTSEQVKHLDQTEITYDINGQNPLTLTTNYFYDNAANMQPVRIESNDSKGNIIKTYNRTALEKTDIITAMTLTANASSAIDNMVSRNMVSQVIQQEKQRAGVLMSRSLVNYKAWDAVILTPENIEVQNAAFPREIRIQFTAYDSKGNLLSQQKVNDLSHAYIYDYSSNYLVADVTNAVQADVAYTSFEADGTSKWSGVNAANIISDVNSITGKKYYSQTAFTLFNNLLNTGTSYIVSYWTKNASAYAVTGTQAGWPKQGRVVALNGQVWRYFEHLVTGVTTVNVTGSGTIDELRLYPSNAQMTTYTYEPLIGISSACDINNKITYYEYDLFQRLKTIRDQDGNILKTFDYQYQQ